MKKIGIFVRKMSLWRPRLTCHTILVAVIMRLEVHTVFNAYRNVVRRESCYQLESAWRSVWMCLGTRTLSHQFWGWKLLDAMQFSNNLYSLWAFINIWNFRIFFCLYVNDIIFLSIEIWKLYRRYPKK